LSLIVLPRQAFKALGSVVLMAVGASFMCSEATPITTQGGTGPIAPGIDVEMATSGDRSATPDRRRASIIETTSFLSPEKPETDEKDKEVPGSFSGSVMKELERGVVESAAGFWGSPQWRQGVFYGMGLSGVNLMLLASYTAILSTIYHYIQHAVVFDLSHAIGFGIGVNGGVNAWLRILIGLLQLYKHRIRANALSHFIQVLGALLMLLGLSLGHSLVTTTTAAAGGGVVAVPLLGAGVNTTVSWGTEGAEGSYPQREHPASDNNHGALTVHRSVVTQRMPSPDSPPPSEAAGSGGGHEAVVNQVQANPLWRALGGG